MCARLRQPVNGGYLQLRCRRKDLPVAAQPSPPEWPKYYRGKNWSLTDAFIRYDSAESEGVWVSDHGVETSQNDCHFSTVERSIKEHHWREITEAEAMARVTANPTPSEVFPKWYVPRDPDPTIFTAVKRESPRKGLQFGPQSTPLQFRWDGICQSDVDDGRWVEVTEAEAMATIAAAAGAPPERTSP